MIAHYIAAGRLMAEKALIVLSYAQGNRDAQPNPDLPRQAVNVEDIKIERFSASGLSAEAEAKQEGTWDRERAPAGSGALPVLRHL